MPQLFVVGAERNLKALSDTVLIRQVETTTRMSALEAIRVANPGLDLDRLDPGTVVLLPDVEGVRPATAGEPLQDTAGDLVARVKDGIGALMAAGEAAEEQRRLERQEAEEVLADPEMERLARQVPELVANMESVRASLQAEDADADAGQVLESLRQAVDVWAADLDRLGKLNR